MANALVAGGSVDAIRKGLSCLNFAALWGYGDTQASASGGTTAGVRAQIEALSITAGISSDALRQASKGIQMAANAGIDFTGTSTLATQRALFTALDPALSSGYTGGGLAE